MEFLRTLQEIFDNNKEAIIDGEYLKAMDTLKLLFEREKDLKRLEHQIYNVFGELNESSDEEWIAEEIVRPPSPEPQVPDPNLPRQRRDTNIPYFYSMESRQIWIEQNNRHECEFCGYILRTRSQLLNHQQRSLCESLRNQPRTRPERHQYRF